MSLRKKPWNRVNAPVYSVVSHGSKGYNMHICTYVTPVSMKPKQYVVALYHPSRTLENVQENPEFILQLLGENQFNLITLLGKLSGKSIDKIDRLDKRNLLCEWKGFPVLKEALAVLQLKAIGSWEAGDHTCFLCDVLAYNNRHTGKALDLDELKARRIIRA